MTFAPGAQDLRIYAASVVAHQNPQLVNGIVEFDFHTLRPRVAEGVCQSLTADAIDLIANERMYGLRFAFDNQSKIDSQRYRQLLWNSRKSFLQIAAASVGRAQPADSPAAIFDYGSHQFQHASHD